MLNRDILPVGVRLHSTQPGWPARGKIMDTAIDLRTVQMPQWTSTKVSWTHGFGYTRTVLVADIEQVEAITTMVRGRADKMERALMTIAQGRTVPVWAKTLARDAL